MNQYGKGRLSVLKELRIYAEKKIAEQTAIRHTNDLKDQTRKGAIKALKSLLIFLADKEKKTVEGVDFFETMRKIEPTRSYSQKEFMQIISENRSKKENKKAGKP